MGFKTGPRKCLMICCSVTAILVAVILVTTVVLFLTILKPKQPILTPQPVVVENAIISSDGVNVTLGLTVTIDNRNYGSFHYNDSTTYVSYRGTGVAEAPIKEDTLPARTKHNISTSVLVFADRMAMSPGFYDDLLAGVFNFTSSTALRGKVKVLEMFKMKATTYTICDISISVVNQTADSVCKAKYDL